MTDEKSTALASQKQEPTPLFVHSELDDFGLLSSHFRVLGHIARCGDNGCWASIDTIAKKCRLDDTTVRTALKNLLDCRMITKEDRPGETNLCRIAPMSQWGPPLPKEGTTADWEGGGGKRRDTTPRKRRGATPPKRGEAIVISESNLPESNPKDSNLLSETVPGDRCLQAQTSHKPKSVEEVVKHSLGLAGAKLDGPSLNRIRKQLDEAERAYFILADLHEPAREAVKWAFRFIHYNNRHGWKLAAHWRTAFGGFKSNCDYGDGAKMVPLDWQPFISWEPHELAAA